MSTRLPTRIHIVEMKHKYAEGDRVRVTNHKHVDGAEGVICALIPFTFFAPGYYVNVNSMVFAASERSIERIEVKEV